MKSTINDLDTFLEEEFTSTIAKCNILFTSSPDKLVWKHLKYILKDKSCLKNIINITNACIEIGYWLSHFKMLTTIIIPKPKKALYDSPKVFELIVLLNTLGKLIEKVNRLQFHAISNNFIHQSQLGGLKFKSTSNVGIVLTHFIHMEWVRNLATSTLMFDISQFFPLLNHHLLTLILEKAGFDLRVVKFFSNYLVNGKTQYFWNSFSSSFFNIDIGVSQGSALSHILSALYLSPLLHILEIYLKNLKIPVSILSFVDDGLIIAQRKSLSLSNFLLFYSYNVVSILLKFGLTVEHSKTKVFHFSRSYSPFNPPLLDLSSFGGPILLSKDFWKYLGFIFNRKLSFHQHINFDSNKAIFTVKCMKILRNLVRSLIPHYKQLLYRSCILPITLYGFQL